ncbi:MAG: F0F1 ATP synthase subunit B' [Alphaproteobacteria bacterium]|nr:F0F1 ATP synthase subunit B' [Alphaproteobacteria bacterium]
MPQLEQIDTYVSQLFWLAITFAALYIFLRKVVLPGIGEILEERQERIRSDLDKAAQLKENAEEVREAYEASLSEGRSQAQRVIREAADAAAQEATRQQAALGEKIASDIAEAENRIAAAREEALANLRSVAGELAQDVVQRMIGARADGAAADRAVDAASKERG